jgi:Fuc2NAc and GlcNAc transferase
MVLGLLPSLQKIAIDTPNSRSSHFKPTPRGGGIAFVIIGSFLFFLSSNGESRWIPIICLPLAVTGLLDDLKGLPASWRYVIQVLTAIAILGVAKLAFSPWSFMVALILIPAIINFVNFMDGLDGLVAGCSVLLLAGTSSWTLSGAILGFLIWNWSPAKVFMGDVGSTFIGAVYAAMIFQESSIQSAFNIFLLGFPLFADAFTCVVRRFFMGKNIFSAHRMHLFQRLHQAGWHHSRVASLYILATALLTLSHLVGGTLLLLIVAGFEFLAGIYLDLKIAVEIDET